MAVGRAPRGRARETRDGSEAGEKTPLHPTHGEEKRGGREREKGGGRGGGGEEMETRSGAGALSSQRRRPAALFCLAGPLTAAVGSLRSSKASPGSSQIVPFRRASSPAPVSLASRLLLAPPPPFYLP